MSVTRIHDAPASDYGWQAEAACAGASGEMFLGPDVEDRSTRHLREGLALSLCGVCPVRRACLDHAVLVPERYGVWGGTTPQQRRLLTEPGRGSLHREDSADDLL